MEKVGIFTDGKGNPSVMRWAMFITLVFALFMVVADGFGWTTRPTSWNLYLLLFGGAFGGKVCQKVAEIQIGE